jgi:hypothetical protein
MDEVLSVLKRARERLAKPGAWTQGELARDASGYGVPGYSASAVCWCALGAVEAEVGSGATSFIDDELEKSSPHFCVAEFNDSADSVEQVLDLFDRAIARLESEQKP